MRLPRLAPTSAAGLLLALAALQAAAQPGDIPSRDSKDGFSGVMVVTADPDWLKRWMTPSTDGFRLATTKEVRLGETIHVLTFISNPGLDARDHADVRCTLRLTRPDGAADRQVPESPCFGGGLAGSPRHVYLVNLAVQVFAEESDPVGVYTVDMLLRDAVRGVELPLRTRFELKGAGE